MKLLLSLDSDLDGLDGLAARVTDMRPAMEGAADLLVEANTAHVRGFRFRRLSESRARAKARAGLSPRPLLGGELERSLTGHGRFAVRQVGVDDVRVGTKDPVANLHKAGTKRMPARPPVRLTPAVRRHVTEHLHGYVLTGAT